MCPLGNITMVLIFSNFFFVIQFNVPFKIISAHYYETGQSVGGAKTGEPPREKTPGTPASRTLLVSHVPGMGLETTPDTAMR